MNKLILILVTLLSFPAISQTNPFSTIKVNRSDAPYIFKMMVEHIKLYPSTKTDNIEIINNLKRLNKNFSYIDKVNSIFLVNSETHKTILDAEKVQKGPRASLRLAELNMAEGKWSKFRQIYTDFSRFLIQLVVSDFTEFKENNFINQAQNQNSSTIRNPKKFLRLKKILKYSGPWVHKVNTTAPDQFNKDLTPIIRIIIKNLADQSEVFAVHSKGEVLQNKALLVGLNSQLVYSYLNNGAAPNQQSPGDNPQQSAKKDAEKDVKNLKVSIPPNVSKDIDKLIKKIDKK